MKKCSDCKHRLRFKEGGKLFCSLEVKPDSINPETGKGLYQLDWLNNPSNHLYGSCTWQRQDYYTFWSSRLKVDNCGMIARFHEEIK